MEEMEQLTEYIVDSFGNKKAVLKNKAACIHCEYSCAECDFSKAMMNLAAYEDIGTPEQFQELMDAQKNEILTVEELREIQIGTDHLEWVYIKCLKQFESKCKKSAYYRVQVNFSGVEVFCCGYPGILFEFDYTDYGKTWLAYRHKPEEETE